MRSFLRSVLVVGGAAAASSLFASAAIADPLGGKEAWDFTPQNRAAIAALIKQIEDPGSGGPTTIVCGGNSGAGGAGTGAGASATANDACIIVSNSSGAIINSGQASDGNQGADASANSKTSSARSGSKPGGSIDEVDAILNGNKQGL